MREQIKKIIYQALTENNALLSTPIDLSLGEDTPLFGVHGQLDSLSLVSLIVAIEENVETKTGKILLLASEKTMSHHRSPFATIRSLIDHTLGLVQGEAA